MTSIKEGAPKERQQQQRNSRDSISSKNIRNNIIDNSTRDNENIRVVNNKKGRQNRWEHYSSRTDIKVSGDDINNRDARTTGALAIAETTATANNSNNIGRVNSNNRHIYGTGLQQQGC
jgi:hypothetical protein